MEVCRSIEEISASPRKQLFMALGNFDGVHIGHRELMKQTVKLAAEQNGTAGVFTFYPHPLKVLYPEQSPPLLLPLEEKLQMIEDLGLDLVLLAPFTREFAGFSPRDFVREVLCQSLQISGVVVGYNYSFGRGGLGSPELLAELGKEHGFSVKVMPPVEAEGVIVSSTVVRELLLSGEVKKASRFLGYRPFLKGEVVHGDKRGGQKMGFPTANLTIPEELLVPGNGVYAVEVVIGDTAYTGVANIGVRPTFKQDNKRNVEVNIFDFSENIYGQQLKVIFVDRIRGEKAFSGMDELVKQIKQDTEKARRLLNGLSVKTEERHILRTI